MTDPNAVPSIREELERKTLDELVRLAHCAQEGVIEQGEYALIAKSIWHITSGLIPTESGELVAKAADEFPMPVRRAVFFKNGDLYMFAWRPDRDDFLFVKTGASHPKPVNTTTKVSSDERRERLKKLFSALATAGWKRFA